jgi:hypothetical protein
MTDFRLITLAFLVLFLYGTAGAAVPAGERERIDRLLAEVGASETLVFIRNGNEYTAQEAVEHLRLKLRRAGSQISTAEEFIDRLATRSSVSGKPYLIRRHGQPPEPAGAFLHGLLRNLSPSGR